MIVMMIELLMLRVYQEFGCWLSELGAITDNTSVNIFRVAILPVHIAFLSPVQEVPESYFNHQLLVCLNLCISSRLLNNWKNV